MNTALLLIYTGIVECFSDAKNIAKIVLNEIINFFKSIFFDYVLNPNYNEHVSFHYELIEFKRFLKNFHFRGRFCKKLMKHL
jgi:hypothetical protein